MAITTPAPRDAGLERELEAHRRELTGYCYRMLGSGFEAEDAVQETMVRAWRNASQLEARAALKSWLYRIATNVCLDMLDTPQRRARPMDLGPSGTADAAIGPEMPDGTWVLPIASAKVLPDEGDPAELAAARETLRLAFVAALQHLPPRQRAVLILREVLHWRAQEVADLLDTSVASVNSALQRARATLEQVDLEADQPAAAELSEEDRRLIDRYLDAFARYDVDELVTLLHDEVKFSMPPYRLWLQGPDQVAAWLLGQGIGCRGSRIVATEANGGVGYATYRPAEPGTYRPFAVVVLEHGGGKVTGIHNFLYRGLFDAFGLPAELRD
jgi:RNA polymerase sigma-70 factor (ECF subfamily)